MVLSSRSTFPFQRQHPNSSSLYIFRSCTTSLSLLPKSIKAVRIAPLSLQSLWNSRWKSQNHLYEHRATVTLEEYHLSLYHGAGNWVVLKHKSCLPRPSSPLSSNVYKCGTFRQEPEILCVKCKKKLRSNFGL